MQQKRVHNNNPMNFYQSEENIIKGVLEVESREELLATTILNIFQYILTFK